MDRLSSNSKSEMRRQGMARGKSRSRKSFWSIGEMFGEVRMGDETLMGWVVEWSRQLGRPNMIAADDRPFTLPGTTTPGESDEGWVL